MALNVKAAMFICTGFIIGLCWFVSESDLPIADAASSSGELLPVGSGGSRTAAAEPAPAVTKPTAVASKFAHDNPFATQESANRAGKTETHRTVASVAVPPAERRRVALPPVADPAAAAEVFAAATQQPTEQSRPLGGMRLAMIMPPHEEPVAAPEPTQVEVASAPEPRKYTVRRGDNLTRISRREFDSDDARLVALLMAVNPKLRDRPDRVLVGEQLDLPDQETVRRVLGGEKMELVLASAKGNPPAPKLIEATELADVGRSQGTPGWRWYTIRESDSLTSIARRFLKDERRWRELAEMNGLADPNRLLVGHRIKLPRVIALASG